MVACGTDVALRFGEVPDLLLDVFDDGVNLPLDGVYRFDGVHVVVCSCEQLVWLRFLLLCVGSDQLVFHELVAEGTEDFFVHAAELDEVIFKEDIVEEDGFHYDDRLVWVEHVDNLPEKVFDGIVVHLEGLGDSRHRGVGER